MADDAALALADVSACSEGASRTSALAKASKSKPCIVDADNNKKSVRNWLKKELGPK
jgi:hypothetical protein